MKIIAFFDIAPCSLVAGHDALYQKAVTFLTHSLPNSTMVDLLITFKIVDLNMSVLSCAKMP
jgi:hypothetical protein